MRRVYLGYLEKLCSQPHNCPRQARTVIEQWQDYSIIEHLTSWLSLDAEYLVYAQLHLEKQASHLSEIDNKSGVSNCNFSTFLSVIIKSLYMSRYLVVFILFPLFCIGQLTFKSWIVNSLPGVLQMVQLLSKTFSSPVPFGRNFLPKFPTKWWTLIISKVSC